MITVVAAKKKIFSWMVIGHFIKSKNQKIASKVMMMMIPIKKKRSDDDDNDVPGSSSAG